MQYLLFDTEEPNVNNRYCITDYTAYTWSTWGSINKITSSNFLPLKHYSSLEELLKECPHFIVLAEAPRITSDYIKNNFPELLL